MALYDHCNNLTNEGERRKRPTSDLCDIVLKAWKKGENTEKEASPTNPTSFLQTENWDEKNCKKYRKRKRKAERRTGKEKGRDSKKNLL